MNNILKRIKCFFTGGHKYSDENLRSELNRDEDKIILSNWCVNCGKKYWVEIDINKII